MSPMIFQNEPGSGAAFSWDRRVGQILLSVHAREGNWSRALKEASIHPEFYVYRSKSREEILPGILLITVCLRIFCGRSIKKLS